MRTTSSFGPCRIASETSKIAAVKAGQVLADLLAVQPYRRAELRLVDPQNGDTARSQETSKVR